MATNPFANAATSKGTVSFGQSYDHDFSATSNRAQFLPEEDFDEAFSIDDKRVSRSGNKYYRVRLGDRGTFLIMEGDINGISGLKDVVDNDAARAGKLAFADGTILRQQGGSLSFALSA